MWTAGGASDVKSSPRGQVVLRRELLLQGHWICFVGVLLEVELVTASFEIHWVLWSLKVIKSSSADSYSV